jgi:hypothetical protein
MERVKQSMQNKELNSGRA